MKTTTLSTVCISILFCFLALSCNIEINSNIFDLALGADKNQVDLPISLQGSIPFQVTKTGYDFGYQASNANHQLTFTNNGSAFRLTSVRITNVLFGELFSVVSYPENVIDRDQNFSITIRFTPEATRWSEADLVLVDSNNRKLTVRLIGSGFPQPGTISDLALWLRADRLTSNDVTIESTSTLINSWPNAANSLQNGSPFAGMAARRPELIISNELNKQPVLRFNNAQHMVVTANEEIGENITNNPDGMTLFIPLRTAATINSNRYILWPQTTLASTNGFPRVYANTWNPGTGNQLRWYLWSTTAIRYPEDSVGSPILTNSSYILSFRLNTTTTAPQPTWWFWKNGKYLRHGNLSGDIWTEDNYRATGENNHRMRRLHIGAQTTSASFFMGDIPEVIIYSRPLTDIEISQVTNYLSYRYGITLE